MADTHPGHHGRRHGVGGDRVLGVAPLVKSDVRITGENWLQKMLSLTNRGGTDHLKLSRMNFVGAGPAMRQKLARATWWPAPRSSSTSTLFPPRRQS
jgi:hypothetical protein